MVKSLPGTSRGNNVAVASIHVAVNDCTIDMIKISTRSTGLEEDSGTTTVRGTDLLVKFIIYERQRHPGPDPAHLLIAGAHQFEHTL